MGRPSVGNSGQGLPPRLIEKRPFDSNSQQHLHTDGTDSYSQSLEDSGQSNQEVVIDKNTDAYKNEMKKGNANILVCRELQQHH